MKISNLITSSLIALSSILGIVPNAHAEVKCGARWDGTPRCENWLGQ